MNYYEDQINSLDTDSEIISVVFSDSEGNKTNRLNLNIESIEVIERKLKEIKDSLQADTLRVGDTVLWKGSWGRDAEIEVVVEHIEVNCSGKYGTEADSVEWSEVKGRSVMVDLDNGKWAYGGNIRKK